MQLRDLVLLNTGYDIDLSQAFLGALLDVGQVYALFERTAHDLEVRYFSDMRLHCALEEIKTQRSIGIRSYLPTIDCRGVSSLGDTWGYISEECHRAAYAHILQGTDTEYRVHVSEHNPLPHSFDDLCFIQRALVKDRK